MKSQKENAITFKALHEQPNSFIIPNPWDRGTARLLENIGFNALATTSAGLAFSLGRQDLSNKLSLDEILDNAKEIISATELQWIIRKMALNNSWNHTKSMFQD